MQSDVKRIFVEKKKGFDIEANSLYKDLKENLLISNLKSVRIINRYDIEGISDEELLKSRNIIFSEPTVDCIYDENIRITGRVRYFAIEYLPGQFDQRADSASQCIQILTQGEKPDIKAAKIIVLEGEISSEEFEKIKNYCINPVESQEAKFEKPETIKTKIAAPAEVETVKGFMGMNEPALYNLLDVLGLAMSIEDIKFCNEYFRVTEKRDPTITEIRLIDTYWSDHCRHTTFATKISCVEMDEGKYSGLFSKTYKDYLDSRRYVHENKDKDISLMDLATISMKELRKKGLLDNLDLSDEINACSIAVDVDVDGKNQEWLIMFKNETHNHPTEIEPFGGAATCLGGAIRDPLSGRTYVYQAMRVTGSGDPRTKIKDTISGKLPQRKITKGAASGYSSYGNQIGLATGQVSEIYDDGFVAKRMEIGAVIGAAPKVNVVRSVPSKGDVIILLGGRTGRDGCGGATGSSKEHNEDSLISCGAEVQKGNPPTERKIQRLFRNENVSRMIKRCNDFGAGGVSVAIGELADGLEINLDAVSKKYEGLDGTELAISESQERMAVVVSKEDESRFINEARNENLEAATVAVINNEKRLVMKFKNKIIVDISRDFLNTNGVKQNVMVKTACPDETTDYFNASNRINSRGNAGIKNLWLNNLQNLNICNKKGLVEMFDSSIGAATVLMPFGGKYQLSPQEGMAAKIPVLHGHTKTGTLMSYGYNPEIGKWSPFHGAVYSIIESVAKIVAMGGDYKKIRMTFQEYFEKLGKDQYKWGKPFCALLGAYYAQKKLSLAAIGGKDSMSGTFMDLTVPPTLVAFSVATVDVENVISSEFKEQNSKVVLLKLNRDEYELPDFEMLEKNYVKVHELVKKGKVLSAYSIKSGGIAEAVSKMCIGNKIGFRFTEDIDENVLFMPDYGSILIEIPGNENEASLFSSLNCHLIGNTTSIKSISVGNVEIDIDDMINKYSEPLEDIFKTSAETPNNVPKKYNYEKTTVENSKIHIARPRVFMPVFPGTNCEYDTGRAFEKAGGSVDTFVINNLSSKEIEQSIKSMTEKINNSQIVMLPGGFSGGDEPDGSGKFIATAFRNPYVREAITNLIQNRDGLILGICNGFQALIKLGLVPYGEIIDIDENCPTLTFNSIGRHMSCMVRTRIASNLSPWLNCVSVSDIHTIPISHGEGRFVADNKTIEIMKKNGQIATQYVDEFDNPTYDIRYNPNGSVESIEGITSPDGRIFGKMAHSERIGTNVAKNICGKKDQMIFKSGVEYFG
ncbi:MAG: phosphoribosylformylglycinamidine synthase [Clostridia bacterium]|jgi:phosphoribosylformylglycinamidine synthase